MSWCVVLFGDLQMLFEWNGSTRPCHQSQQLPQDLIHMGKSNLKQVAEMIAGLCGGIFADNSTCINWQVESRSTVTAIGFISKDPPPPTHPQRPVIRTAIKETVEHLMIACELQESPYFVCYQRRTVALSKGI